MLFLEVSAHQMGDVLAYQLCGRVFKQFLNFLIGSFDDARIVDGHVYLEDTGEWTEEELVISLSEYLFFVSSEQLHIFLFLLKQVLYVDVNSLVEECLFKQFMQKCQIQVIFEVSFQIFPYLQALLF